MTACYGHLTNLFRQLGQGYDKVHGTSEGDGEVDTASEGGRSASSSWRQDGATWKRTVEEEEAPRKKASEEEEGAAVQSKTDLIAQAFGVPATECGRSSARGGLTTEEESPEPKSPLTSNNCRNCGAVREEVVTHCKQ